MRTLSARILLGFVALTIMFGVFVTTIVVNLHEVEDQAALILRGYVPLAMTLTDLAQQQEDLKSYLEQGITDASGPGEIRATIKRLRKQRDRGLDEIFKIVQNELVTADGSSTSDASKQFPRTERRVGDLKQYIAKVAVQYSAILAAPPVHVPGRADPSFQAAYSALDKDHQAALRRAAAAARPRAARSRTTVIDLRDEWKGRTARTKDQLADNERTILWRAIYLGIASVVLGLVITGWVAVNLRPLRRLREGARRIAAGDYGKRVSESGPTEIADLAREFNSMGRAVQEREEEKLRAARLAMVGKMAAQIAHEVRNPLSSIGLNTELLEDELGENATEARELCRAIHTEVNRLTEVTETYLGLRGGKPKLARESLNAIIGDLVGFVRSDLATRQVDLETDLDAERPQRLHRSQPDPAMLDQSGPERS